MTYISVRTLEGKSCCHCVVIDGTVIEMFKYKRAANQRAKEYKVLALKGQLNQELKRVRGWA